MGADLSGITDELRSKIAMAIQCYDWLHGLSANGTPGEHTMGETDAVLAVLREWLAGCTVVHLPEDAEHLNPSASDRGFTRLPPLPTTYGGEVAVYESSAASGPHLWLRVKERDAEAHGHLPVDTAYQLAQQLLHAIAHHYQGPGVGDPR